MPLRYSFDKMALNSDGAFPKWHSPKWHARNRHTCKKAHFNYRSNSTECVRKMQVAILARSSREMSLTHFNYRSNSTECVRKMQVGILARSSREMSLTVPIVWQYILSRVRISVQPSNFCIREKHPKPWEIVSPAGVFKWMASDLHCRQRTGRHRIAIACTAVTATAVCVACVRAWCVCNIR